VLFAHNINLSIPLDQVEAFVKTDGVVANLEAKAAGEIDEEVRDDSVSLDGADNDEVQRGAEEEEEEEEEESDDVRKEFLAA
jgi:hypothetical protein